MFQTQFKSISHHARAQQALPNCCAMIFLCKAKKLLSKFLGQCFMLHLPLPVSGCTARGIEACSAVETKNILAVTRTVSLTMTCSTSPSMKSYLPTRTWTHSNTWASQTTNQEGKQSATSHLWPIRLSQRPSRSKLKMLWNGLERKPRRQVSPGLTSRLPFGRTLRK